MLEDVHERMRRKHILLCLAEMFCRYRLDPSGSYYLLAQVLLFSFCLDDLFIDESEVLNSSTLRV